MQGVVLTRGGVCLLATFGLLAGITASADEFSFDVRASFDAERQSAEAPVFGIGGDGGTLFTETDTDTTALAAAWYFDGASDDNGPYSRAVFLSRASSLNFAYRRTDVDVDLRLDPPPQPLPFPGVGVPPIPIPGEPIPITAPFFAPPTVENDEFALGGRYVWKDSGWFVFGNAAFGDGDTGTTGFSVGVDTRQFTVGGGVYLGEGTAIEVAIIDAEAEISLDTGGSFEESSTGFVASVTHIGKLGDTWQYGLDAAIIDRDQPGIDTGAALRGSLFPRQNLAFGIEIETEVPASFVSGTRYAVFGSWFVTRQLEFFGEFGVVDTDSRFNAVTDLDVFSFGFLGRF